MALLKSSGVASFFGDETGNSNGINDFWLGTISSGNSTSERLGTISIAEIVVVGSKSKGNST